MNEGKDQLIHEVVQLYGGPEKFTEADLHEMRLMRPETLQAIITTEKMLPILEEISAILELIFEEPDQDKINGLLEQAREQVKKLEVL